MSACLSSARSRCLAVAILTVTGLLAVAHPASADVDSVSGSVAAVLIAPAYVTPAGIAGSAVEPSDSYRPLSAGRVPVPPSRRMSTPYWMSAS